MVLELAVVHQITVIIDKVARAKSFGMSLFVIVDHTDWMSLHLFNVPHKVTLSVSAL